MSTAKILTNAELSLLRTRLTMNPTTLIDPAVAMRLLATAEHYRNGVEIAEKFLPSFVREQVAL